ncbi:MAG: hypothetical protein JWM41_2922 [Gemmatimonadetes bacterium]|nr:hypothetical protein [Gemmatimonadota bacterium]
MPDSKIVGDIAVVALVAAKAVYDVFGGKRRDRRHTAALDGRFATLELSLEQRFNGVSIGMERLGSDIREVRAFVVGPDGENGIRGDLREVKERVKAIEERELGDRRVGAYDRRGP